MILGKLIGFFLNRAAHVKRKQSKMGNHEGCPYRNQSNVGAGPPMESGFKATCACPKPCEGGFPCLCFPKTRFLALRGKWLVCQTPPFLSRWQLGLSYQSFRRQSIKKANGSIHSPHVSGQGNPSSIFIITDGNEGLHAELKAQLQWSVTGTPSSNPFSCISTHSSMKVLFHSSVSG